MLRRTVELYILVCKKMFESAYENTKAINVKTILLIFNFKEIEIKKIFLKFNKYFSGKRNKLDQWNISNSLFELQHLILRQMRGWK